MSPRSKSGYIPTLDGWRAIAVAMVFLNHAPFGGSPWFDHSLGRLAPYGELGVDLFFAISGLLICTRLLEEEKKQGRISLRNFYIRRSFRILPAAYVFLAAVALLSLLRWIPVDWPALGSAVAFARNYFTCLVRDTPANRFTGHFWSLAIEEHFYLILPAVLVFFRKSRKHVLLAMTVCAFLWLGIYVAITPPADRSIFWDRRSDLRMAALLFPAWLALCLDSPGVRARLTRWLNPTVCVLLCVAGAALMFLKSHFYPHPPTVTFHAHALGLYESVPRGGDASKTNQFIVPLFFPLLVLSTVLRPASWLSRVLEWRALKSVGRISYSLYLWQQLFWVHPYQGWPLSRLEKPLIGFPLSIACAVLSYYLIEKPFIRVGHRLAPPPSPGHADLDAVQASRASSLQETAAGR